jgi:hypothetical protein
MPSIELASLPGSPAALGEAALEVHELIGLQEDETGRAGNVATLAATLERAMGRHQWPAPDRWRTRWRFSVPLRP